MTDLHVTRKDSSASSDNSSENGPCKLTYENLKLHDKLSSAAPPYSSLSRLEEGPSMAPIVINKKHTSPTPDDNEYRKYSRRLVFIYQSSCCSGIGTVTKYKVLTKNMSIVFLVFSLHNVW